MFVYSCCSLWLQATLHKVKQLKYVEAIDSICSNTLQPTFGLMYLLFKMSILVRILIFLLSFHFADRVIQAVTITVVLQPAPRTT